MAPYFIPLFSRMQKLPLLSLFTYITSSLSGVHAFSVTIGTPTQCDDLVVSWIGKHTSSTCDVPFLNLIIIIVRWTSTIRDSCDSCLSALLYQAHVLCANLISPGLSTSVQYICTIISIPRWRRLIFNTTTPTYERNTVFPHHV
jgi:hypothetical protein